MELLLGWIVFACLVHLGSTSTSTAGYASGTTIAGGLFHTCMIREDNSLVCWGGGGSDYVSTLSPTVSTEDAFGTFGQIGSGDNETIADEDNEMGSALEPVDLANASAEAVAAGQSHTCVLLDSGEVACFGYNGNGQLGTEDNTTRGMLPSDMGDGLDFVDLGTGRTATDIGCGQHHCCAILDDGSLKCWGINICGMLGLGDTVSRGDAPGTMGDDLETVDLGTGRTAVYVEGGRYHTCALLDNDSVKCWGGRNESGHNYGQLGQGNTWDIGSSSGQMGDALPEIDFGSDRTVKMLAVGWFHTCVILDDQTVRCIGRNHDGQLGLGDTEDRGDEEGEMGDDLETVDLGSGKKAVGITAGRWHTCVLLDDDTVKCYGVNTADDLGAGQLGLEDDENRADTIDTTGDGLETVDLGAGRTPTWVRAAFDHTCVLFADNTVKCWGLNASGQLGLGDTDDHGDEEGSMGSSLSFVAVGGSGRILYPSNMVVEWTSTDDDGDGGGLSDVMIIVISIACVVFVVVACGVSLVCLRCRERRWQAKPGGKLRETVTAEDNPKYPRRDDSEIQRGLARDEARDVERGLVVISQPKSGEASSEAGAPSTQIGGDGTSTTSELRTLSWATETGNPQLGSVRAEHSSMRSDLSAAGAAAGLAAAGTVGVVAAGTMAAGWSVLGSIAENLPWVGVAYYLLNEIVDMVETKQGLEGNMDKIKRWAGSLQDVLVMMNNQLRGKPSIGAKAIRAMSDEVVSSLQELVDSVAAYNQKGAMVQYIASRSCQKAVDAADTALRGALMKLSVGQGAVLMGMVSRLEDAGLVVDEKLDMIIDHMEKQEAQAARLELRLAEFSEQISEALGQFIASGGVNPEHPVPDLGPAPTKKNLRELGKEQLNKLQISKDSITFPTKRPFAAGAHAQIYQVLHNGVVRAAKVVNLTRLGLSTTDVDRVFGRFVKELYILSQMHSERVVSVYGANASASELTLIMEYAERGSLRTIINDEDQRKIMRTTPGVLHNLLTDTAEGMAYIYKMGVEHRDLKTENCLVTHDWRAKITDFGLSKTTDAITTASTMSVSPFRGGTLAYSALELLPGAAPLRGEDGPARKIPAELSDSFSYGVVMWEVVASDGGLPWAEIPPESIPYALKSGKRLVIPADCPEKYRETMTQCWHQDPLQRPTFERILRRLRNDSENQSGASTTTVPAPKSESKVAKAPKHKSVFQERSSWLSKKQRSQSESPRGRRRGPGPGYTKRSEVKPYGKVAESPRRISASARRSSRKFRRRRSQSESPLRSTRSGDTAAGSTARSLSSRSHPQARFHSTTSESKADLERVPSDAESRSSYWDSDEGAKSPGPGADGAEDWSPPQPGSDAGSDDLEPGRNLIRLRSAASMTFAIDKNASSRSVAARALSDSSTSDSQEDDLAKSAPAASRPSAAPNTSLSASEHPGSNRTGQRDPQHARAPPPSYWDILSQETTIPAVSHKPSGDARTR